MKLEHIITILLSLFALWAAFHFKNGENKRAVDEAVDADQVISKVKAGIKAAIFIYLSLAFWFFSGIREFLGLNGAVTRYVVSNLVIFFAYFIGSLIAKKSKGLGK